MAQPDPVFTLTVMAIVWIVFGAVEGYRRGFKRGQDVGRAERAPRPLTDGMTIEEAAEATDMTVQEFRIAISRK